MSFLPPLVFSTDPLMEQMPSTLNPQTCDTTDLTLEDRIRLAIEAIENSGVKPNGTPVYSVRAAAIDFNIPRSTLGNRFKGVSHHL